MQRAILVRAADLLEDRERDRSPERHHLATGLQLAEEEDVVDQLARLLDLLARLIDELVDVGARERRALEQDEEPGERGAQLVRDGGREPGAELLVGRELRQRGEEEDDGRRVDEERLLAHAPTGRTVPEGRHGSRAGRHESALGVEDDHRVGEADDERPNPLGVVIHHPFTSPSPFGDP